MDQESRDSETIRLLAVDTTAIILAGGQSQRMKLNKALLPLDGKPMVAHICEVMKTIFDSVILVTNNPMYYFFLCLQLVTDLFGGKGPVGGIYTGLFYASSSHTFAIACDMPFVRKEVVQYLLNQVSPRWDAVVPLTPNGHEPLHAVYARGCIKKIHAQLMTNDLKITSFYERIRVRSVNQAELSATDPEARSYVNINTMDDFTEATSLLKGIVPKST